MSRIMTQSHPGRTMLAPVRQAALLQSALLVCGVLSSAVYVAADLLGGMRYEGYSFSSQAISELMATGAPSESFVDPLFILYGVFMLAFGAGVFREGVGRGRSLRTTGAILVAYAAIGFTGPTLFEMHPRGTGTAASGDLPHIVLTAVLAFLTLVAVGAGALAFGRRFRLYSLATLLVMSVLGVLSVPNGARLAAGQPTPGFGILERVDIYASLVWMAALAIALLRRKSRDTGRVRR